MILRSFFSLRNSVYDAFLCLLVHTDRIRVPDWHLVDF